MLAEGDWFTYHYAWGPGPKKVRAPFCSLCWPFSFEQCLQCFANKPEGPWGAFCQACSDAMDEQFMREEFGEDWKERLGEIDDA